MLETTFRTSAGTLVLTDALAVNPASGSDTNAHPLHRLIRRLRAGSAMEVLVVFSPRFEFGRTVPRLVLEDENHAIVFGGPDGLEFFSELPLQQTSVCSSESRATLESDRDYFLAVTYESPHRSGVHHPDRRELNEQLDTTIDYWADWSSQCNYEGPYTEQVVRSALVIKGLTDSPTGAIVAAPTTSLPEVIGGERNWDYRFTWLRDAALNVYALGTLGYTQEARHFVRWLVRTTAGEAGDLQPLYGVGGERFLHEIELDWLEGYRKSRPVRIGNGAHTQAQHDIYGELLDTAWLHHRHGGEIDDVFWDFLTQLVDVVAGNWHEPDEGIWEPRDGRQHFVSSKIFCWVAVDRAIKLARARKVPVNKSWTALRTQIRRTIDDQGSVGPEGPFRRAFSSELADAANLLAPLVGFVKPDDPRVTATVEETIKSLCQNGFVHRYRCEDGLDGEESPFVICTFWLVDNLALLGRLKEATELFERVLGHANDLGLLAEEIDPETGAGLGNFPQAFSHVGLIGAAMNLAKAANKV